MSRPHRLAVLALAATFGAAPAAAQTITESIHSSGAGGGAALDGAFSIRLDAAGNAYVTGYDSDNAFKITPGRRDHRDRRRDRGRDGEHVGRGQRAGGRHRVPGARADRDGLLRSGRREQHRGPGLDPGGRVRRGRRQ